MNKAPDIILNNIETILGRSGMKWADLARALDADDQVVNNWKRRGVPKGRYLEIAKALGITVEKLTDPDTQLDLPRGMGINHDIKPPLETKNVPWVPWALLRGKSAMLQEPTEKYRVPINKTSDKTFCTSVDTDAMAGKIPRGAIIVVDPDAKPQPGQVVIVDKAGVSLILRRLISDGERMLLVAENPAMPLPVETYLPSTDTIIGVVQYYMGEH